VRVSDPHYQAPEIDVPVPDRPPAWEGEHGTPPSHGYIDPPRFYPLIGPAQLHHAHYKCTVYCSERTIVGYPVPHTLDDREVIEVIYIDHNHFHMVGDVDPYTTPNL
jgi:hypothetical protein